MPNHSIEIYCYDNGEKTCCIVDVAATGGSFKVLPGDTITFMLNDPNPHAKAIITISPDSTTGAKMGAMSLLPIPQPRRPLAPDTSIRVSVNALDVSPPSQPRRPLAPVSAGLVQSMSFFGVIILGEDNPNQRTVRLRSWAKKDWRYKFQIKCCHCCNDCDPGDPPDMEVGP